eukprot:76977-Hanusia_phi.AAC.2
MPVTGKARPQTRLSRARLRSSDAIGRSRSDQSCPADHVAAMHLRSRRRFTARQAGLGSMEFGARPSR